MIVKGTINHTSDPTDDIPITTENIQEIVIQTIQGVTKCVVTIVNENGVSISATQKEITELRLAHFADPIETEANVLEQKIESVKGN